MTTWLNYVVSLSAMLALVPACLFRQNLRRFRPPPEPARSTDLPAISVLIPARNEESAIESSVAAALSSRGVEVEVIVLDDRSDDETPEIVAAMARQDDRLRLVHGPDLPPGWCGKQHACWVLAHEARHPLLVFIDADVRLSSHALTRMAAFLEESGADLASGIPHQETIGLLEKLVIPLIHFILLGFLPIDRMRRSDDPALAAGCGQLFVTRRTSYDLAGGHAAIRETLHDGLKLPRAYRAAGLRTDLFDATDLATCRMYRSATALWNGLSKNAVEGLAAPGLILPMTAILFGGQVLPFLLLVAGWRIIDLPEGGYVLALSALAAAASYYPRWAATRRFRQSRVGALLHPAGVLILLAIQWSAFARSLVGRPSSWKGRSYRPARALESSRRESPTP